MNKTKENVIIEQNYLEDLNKIKETIRNNQNKAMVVVNSAMIMTYYEIGTIINKRKTCGSKYIQNLANDLKEYGKGYSYESLKKMSQFAKNFSDDEIRYQPITQIPWLTIITIISKSSTHEKMLWYIKQTHKNGWCRSMVLYQIEMKAYERKVWGNKYIERLSNDLREYGKGYSYDNLNYMRKFSEEFTKEEIFDQAGRLIPWRTFIEIMKKSKNHKEMLWYINKTHKNGWSRAIVLNQIEMKAYERSLINPTTTDAVTSSNDLTNDYLRIPMYLIF